MLALIVLACTKDDDSILFPETGFYGENILDKSKTEIFVRENSMQVLVPKGAQFKAEIKGLDTSMEGLMPTGIWYIEVVSVNNWAIETFNEHNFTQTFTVIDAGLTSDLRIFLDKGRYDINYFEGGSTNPTFTKTITVDY